MANNYFDNKGNYVNVENLSLADIYHRAFALGVESTPIRDERSKGEWKIYMTGHQGEKTTSITYKCSCCGRKIVYVASDYRSKEEFLSEYPYCHCGAKMEADNDKTD